MVENYEGSEGSSSVQIGTVGLRLEGYPWKSGVCVTQSKRDRERVSMQSTEPFHSLAHLSSEICRNGAAVSIYARNCCIAGHASVVYNIQVIVKINYKIMNLNAYRPICTETELLTN